MTADEFKRWAWPPSKANWFFWAGFFTVLVIIPGSLVWSASRSIYYYSTPTIEKKEPPKAIGPNFKPVEKPTGL